MGYWIRLKGMLTFPMAIKINDPMAYAGVPAITVYEERAVKKKSKKKRKNELRLKNIYKCSPAQLIGTEYRTAYQKIMTIALLALSVTKLIFS